MHHRIGGCLEGVLVGLKLKLFFAAAFAAAPFIVVTTLAAATAFACLAFGGIIALVALFFFACRRCGTRCRTIAGAGRQRCFFAGLGAALFGGFLLFGRFGVLHRLQLGRFAAGLAILFFFQQGFLVCTQGFGTACLGFALCLFFGADNRLGRFFGQRRQFGFAFFGTHGGFVFFGRRRFSACCRIGFGIGFCIGHSSGLRLRYFSFRRALGFGCGSMGFELGGFSRSGFGRSAAGGFGCLKVGIRSFCGHHHRLCRGHGFNWRRRFSRHFRRRRSRYFGTLLGRHRNHAAAAAGFHLYAAHFAVLGGFFAAQGNGAAAV